MNVKSSFLICIIGLLPLVMVLGNSMLIPILPLMEEELNITTAQVGFLLSVFSIIAAIVIPIVGILSDRFGRKKLVLVSLVFVIVGSIVTVWAGKGVTDPFRWILIGRVLQGIGAGGTAPLAMALVGDLFEGKERSKSLGILEVFNGIGKVISPFIGAVAALFFWYTAFYFYFFVSLIAFIGIYLSIRKVNQKKRNEPLKNYRKVLFEVVKKEAKWLFPLSFLSAVGLFLIFGLLVFLSFEIEQVYQINGIFKGIVFIIPLSALTFVSYWTGKKIGNDHQFMEQLLILGSFLMVTPLVFLIFIHNLGAIIFGLTIAASGLGFILPCANTLITSSVGGNERGLIVSLYGMVRFLGVAFGQIFFSLWMENLIEMFLRATLLIILSTIWVVSALKLQPMLKDWTGQLTKR